MSRYTAYINNDRRGSSSFDMLRGKFSSAQEWTGEVYVKNLLPILQTHRLYGPGFAILAYDQSISKDASVVNQTIEATKVL